LRRLEGNERERESSEKGIYLDLDDDDVMNLFLERALEASDFVSGV